MAKKKQPSAQSLRVVAKDAVGPAAKNFGKEIAPVGTEAGILVRATAHTLMRPLFATVWGADKILDWFGSKVSSRVDKIPEEERKEAEIRIAGPAIEAVRFLENEKEIQEIFASIIAKSMDKREIGELHVAFIEIAKQLDALDATVFKLVGGYDRFAIGKWKWSTVNGEIPCHEILSPIAIKDKRYNKTHLTRSIENLNRLKLIDIDFTQSFTEERHYHFFEKDENKNPDQVRPSEEYSLEKIKGIIIITQLGKAFYRAVTS